MVPEPLLTHLEDALNKETVTYVTQKLIVALVPSASDLQTLGLIKLRVHPMYRPMLSKFLLQLNQYLTP